MKKANVKIGEVYWAKVSGKVVPVRIRSISTYGGWNAKSLKTGRVFRLKTAGRLRPRVEYALGLPKEKGKP